MTKFTKNGGGCFIRPSKKYFGKNCKSMYQSDNGKDEMHIFSDADTYKELPVYVDIKQRNRKS